MSDLHRLDGDNQTNWMKLVLRSSVSEDDESKAILAAHNALVAFQRAASSADDTGTALEWTGEDPMWTAFAGARVAVVVTDDDESSLFNYQAWIAGEGAINRPLEGCGPVGCYTLVGGQAWGIDRLTGLAEATT